MHKLILTSDYEVYGNGSGEIDTCLIKPTENILSICDQKNIRICFFVDVCEIWAMQDEISTRSGAMKIIDQMEQIILSGHDIQLHLHPQWIGARFENNSWILNYEYWRLAMVEDLDFGEFGKGVEGLINKGKSWLEKTIKAWDPKYQCKSFRAGAWCIQPEQKILKALKKLGFSKESSVAPGMKFEGKLTKYNFTALEKMPGQWPLGENLSEIDNNSILQEIPIATAKCGISEQLRFTRLKKSRKNPVYPENSGVEIHHKESSSLIEKFRRYILPGYRMLDFASGTTSDEMIFITEQYLKKINPGDPVIAISHPKNFAVKNEFEAFLDWCESNKDIKFEDKGKGYFWR